MYNPFKLKLASYSSISADKILPKPPVARTKISSPNSSLIFLMICFMKCVRILVTLALVRVLVVSSSLVLHNQRILQLVFVS